jgi:hypothetical protein
MINVEPEAGIRLDSSFLKNPNKKARNTMSFHAAKNAFSALQEITEMEDNSAMEQLATGLLELTKALQSEISDLKSEITSLRSRIVSME